MAQTTSRHCECRFMPTVAFAEFTFPIGCTRKTSCLPSSNCSCPSRTKKIHANCRIRRIYFSDRLYSEDELPPEFKLFLPTATKGSLERSRQTCEQKYGLKG